MNHLLVFAFLTTVLVGAWAIFVTRQRYQRHGLSQLRHLLHYVVAFNVMAFGYLVAHYAFTNLIGNNPFQFPRFVLGLSAGVFPMEVGLSWTALRLGWDLRCREFPAVLRRGFAVGVSVFGASYVVGLTLLLKDGGFLWLVRTHMALGVAMTIVLGATFSGLGTCRGRELSEGQRGSVRRLGWNLLSGHLALAASVALPDAAHLPVLAAALLWLTCVPLIWLRGGFDEYHQTSSVAGNGTAAVTALARKHGVTQREREVMELIVQGKSNKEIEDQLCISFSTVKNHAHSLYRKLGVGSRAQVIHLVLVAVSHSGGMTGQTGSDAKAVVHGDVAAGLS